MIYPLVDFMNIFHGAAIYFDFILHIIGFFVLLISHKGHVFLGGKAERSILKYFSIMVISFIFSSVIMACYIQYVYGNYAGETAFSGILGQVLYYVQYIFIIIYNINVFKILGIKEISSILHKLCLFLLALGYYQILCFRVGGVFQSIGSALDVFHILFPEEYMWKLSLTASEGAKAGGLVSILVFPYLLANIILYPQKISYYIQIILWIPVIVFMQSTAAYFMLFAVFFSFGIFLLKKKKNVVNSLFLFVSILVLTIMLIVVCIPKENLMSFFLEHKVFYLLFEKFTDVYNGSSILRKAPILINWKIFLHFPIIGVGNGLQGYFYTTFFPSEYLGEAGVWSQYIKSMQTISNGALFFPSILSGYGIVGTLIFLGYIKKMVKLLIYKKEIIGIFYPMCVFSFAAILVHGFQTEFSGSYFIWFILSIPYMFVEKRDI